MTTKKVAVVNLTEPKPSKNMTKKQIQIFFERLRQQRPNPKTELNYSNPFELLVAVTLSAQATDVSVNKATDKLFPIANTPEQIYALGVEGLKKYIKTISLYNSKVKNGTRICVKKMLLAFAGPLTNFIIVFII